MTGWSLLPNALRPFEYRLCSREFRYHLDVNMPIKFSSEAYFFQAWGSLTSLKSRTQDSQLKVHPEGQDFYVPKKSIDFSRVWTREPWISRRVGYPVTTEADCVFVSQSLNFSGFSRVSPEFYSQSLAAHIILLSIQLFICNFFLLFIAKKMAGCQ